MAAAFAVAALVSASAWAEPVATKVTRRVTESAVDTVLESLNDPAHQGELGAVLSSKGVTDGVRALSASVAEGMIEGVRRRVALEGSTEVFWREIDTNVRYRVTPTAAFATRRVVDAAVGSALSPENAARVEVFAEHAMLGAMKGLARGLREDVGPALASPGMQRAIATTMNTMASNLVRGGDAGLETAKAKNAAEGTPGMLEVVGDRMAWGASVAVLSTAGIAFVVFAVLAALVMRSRRRERRHAAARSKREAELSQLIEQIDGSLGNVDKAALRAYLGVATPAPL